jgi:DNA-binding XRE family transcriptional regulator
MLGHTKTHLTKKNALKAKIKEDLFALKQCYLKKIGREDLSFVQELQEEVASLLPFANYAETINAEEAFKNLTDQYGKAGALLRGVRIREGMNQTEFAKLIGTTQANLSAMENGSRPIGKNKAKLIAEKFGVDYRYFL